jgi:hypothetical protein
MFMMTSIMLYSLVNVVRERRWIHLSYIFKQVKNPQILFFLEF